MPVLTDEELIEIFTVRMGELLEQRPELEPAIYNSFLKFLARREEIAAILKEMDERTKEWTRSFADTNQRVEKVQQDLSEFRYESRESFKQLNERVGGVETGVEQVVQRVEQLDQRVGHVEFDLKSFRDETRQKFEQVDKRFDSLEKRMDEGFKNVQRQFDRFGARWGIRNESLFRETIEALLTQSFGVKVEQKIIGGEQFDVVIYDGQHVLIEITASADAKIQERLERKRRLYTETTGITPTRMILATASIHSRRAQALRDAGIDVIEPEEADQEKNDL